MPRYYQLYEFEVGAQKAKLKSNTQLLKNYMQAIEICNNLISI